MDDEGGAMKQHWSKSFTLRPLDSSKTGMLTGERDSCLFDPSRSVDLFKHLEGALN